MKPDSPYIDIDPYDRAAFTVSGFLHTRETTMNISPTDKGNLNDGSGIETVSFIVQTYRIPDLGDVIMLQRIDKRGATRIAIPPKVAEAIARQRESLGTQTRRAHGKAQAPRLRQLAAERKAAGIPPAFLSNKGPKRRKKGKTK